MAPTAASRRAVFRQIAQQSYVEWPAYNSTPIYDRTTLTGLQEDIRVVSEVWFSHAEHESVDQFVCSLPLAYFCFDPHDDYTGSTQYEMATLFRVFILKELYGWDHETALVEYLNRHPDICKQLGLGTTPDQSTLWRSWNKRFTANLRETVETAARTILIKARNSNVDVLRPPDRKRPRRSDDTEESDLDDQAVLEQAKKVTNHVSHIVYPVFSLDRGESYEIHEKRVLVITNISGAA